MFLYKTAQEPYAGYKRAITREDMALVSGRALDKMNAEHDYRDPLAIASLIQDYGSIATNKKTNVVKCYDIGILTGYPDGGFKPENILTRAEAVAVIRRIMDPSARKRVELPVMANPSPTPIPVNKLERPEKKELGNGVVEVEGVRFDPETDTFSETTGAMRILKAEEFVQVALKYLKFYEHEGKARVRGYIPELPEGYEWDMSIHTGVKEADDRGYWGCGFLTHKGFSPEQTLPPPGNTFDMPMYTNKENIDTIYLNYEVIKVNSVSGGSFYISLTLKKYSRHDQFGGHSHVDTLDPRGFFEW